MKLYKKNELHFEKGYILNKDNEILSLHHGIVQALNELETRVQKVNWLEDQPVACSGPDYNQFERKSSFDSSFKAVTRNRTLEKIADETELFMNAIDEASRIESMNKDIEKNFKRLIEFVDDDTVVAMVSLNPEELRIDTPTIGNPLMMTFDDFSYWISMCYGLIPDNINEEKIDGEQE